MQRTRIAFSVIEEVIVLAQDDGNVILSNLSALSSGRDFLINYPSLSLWKLNQDSPCHFTTLCRPEFCSNVYIGKLTCLNLKVFSEILKTLDQSVKATLRIEPKTEALCEQVCRKMREASVDSFQELDKQVNLHGAVTILKFLNSEITGAKDALQLDPKFPDVVSSFLTLVSRHRGV
jgi:hypothetical protein